MAEQVSKMLSCSFAKISLSCIELWTKIRLTLLICLEMCWREAVRDEINTPIIWKVDIWQHFHISWTYWTAKNWTRCIVCKTYPTRNKIVGTKIIWGIFIMLFNPELLSASIKNTVSPANQARVEEALSSLLSNCESVCSWVIIVKLATFRKCFFLELLCGKYFVITTHV